MSAGAGRLPPPPTTAARPNQTVSERVFVPWAEGAPRGRTPTHRTLSPYLQGFCYAKAARWPASRLDGRQVGSMAAKSARWPPSRLDGRQGGSKTADARCERASRGRCRAQQPGRSGAPRPRPSGFDTHFSSARASVPGPRSLPGGSHDMCVLSTAFSCCREVGRHWSLATEKRGPAILVDENEPRARRAAFTATGGILSAIRQRVRLLHWRYPPLASSRRINAWRRKP